MRVVNIRELKDKLSEYLRAVARGEVLLVTDRGRVVAELRQPSAGSAVAATTPARQRLADAGVMRLGLPHDPAAYDGRLDVALPAALVDAALDATRGDWRH